MGEGYMRTALIRAAYWAVAAALIWIFCRYLLILLLPLAAGLFIACILRPCASFIHRHSGMGKRGASLVSAAAFYAALSGLAWLLGAWLLGQAEALAAELPGFYRDAVQPFISGIGEWLGKLAERVSPRAGAGVDSAFGMANEALAGAATSASGWGLGVLGGAVKKIPMTIATLLTTIFASVFICADYERVVGYLIRLIPERYRAIVLELRDFLLKTLSRVFRAYLILTAITFAEVALGLWLLGIGHVWTMAALTAFFDLLPVLGSGAVLIPWAAWEFFSGNPLSGWGLLALWTAMSVIRELIEPRIVGGQLGLHPLAAILSMYAGLRLAGIGGLILAPIACMTVLRLHEMGVLKTLAKGGD